MNKDYNSSSEENTENKEGENQSLIQRESYYHSIATPEKKVGEDRYYEIFDKDKHKTIAWSVASVVVCAVSLICCFLSWVGLVFGAAGIILALVSRFRLGYFDTLSLVGLIAGIFGMVFGGLFIIWPYIVTFAAAAIICPVY